MADEEKKRSVGNTPAVTAVANSDEVEKMYLTIMSILASLGGNSIEAVIAYSPVDGQKKMPYLLQIHVEPIAEEDMPLIHERLGLLMGKKKDDKK